MMRFAMVSLFSLVAGWLHRSIVLAVAFDASLHQDSHQSQSCGSEKMGIWGWA